jgi:hypothetical protein
MANETLGDHLAPGQISFPAHPFPVGKRPKGIAFNAAPRGPLAAQQIELVQRTGAPPMDPQLPRIRGGKPGVLRGAREEFFRLGGMGAAIPGDLRAFYEVDYAVELAWERGYDEWAASGYEECRGRDQVVARAGNPDRGPPCRRSLERLRACAQHRPRSSRRAPAARHPAAQGATPQRRRRREV